MFELSIATTGGNIFKGEISYLNVPGALGSMGILTGHAPIISSLEPGRLIYETTAGERVSYVVSGGLLELHENEAVVLVDSCEKPGDVDVDRAESSAARAKERLSIAHKDESIDAARAEAALARALNRLKLAGGGSGR